MDKFSRIEVFAKVVEQGSFSKAADKLHITKSAVSKHIQTLEDQLGVRLLNRTTRSINPTEEGQEFYERCVNIIRDMNEAQEQVKSSSNTPSGKLRVSTQHAYGNLCLTPKIIDFIKLYPEITVELCVQGGKVNAVDDGMDLTIFIGQPEDSSFIAKKLEDCPMALVASPEYLELNGEPKNIEQLKEHKHIEFKKPPTRGEWPYTGKEGSGKIKLNEVFVAQNGQTLAYAAERGLGIACIPLYVCEGEIKSGKLVQVMKDYTFKPGLGVYAIFPHKSKLAKKIRLFIDFLAG